MCRSCAWRLSSRCRDLPGTDASCPGAGYLTLNSARKPVPGNLDNIAVYSCGLTRRIDGACDENLPCPAYMPSLPPPASKVSEQVPLVPVADGRAFRIPGPFVRPAFRFDGCPGGAAMTGGRERQIVADAPFKAEYAALPWRMGGEGTMEVLLLCPRQDGQWTVPRGTCSGTRTELRSAERAAFQDAGVTGRLGAGTGRPLPHDPRFGGRPQGVLRRDRVRTARLGHSGQLATRHEGLEAVDAPERGPDFGSRSRPCRIARFRYVRRDDPATG